MKAKFAEYNLDLQEVLIGTPTAGAGAPGSHIETILTQLRSRQIAEEQVETYTRQEHAAMKEKELREAEYERSRQEPSRIQTLATRRGREDQGRTNRSAPGDHPR